MAPDRQRHLGLNVALPRSALRFLKNRPDGTREQPILGKWRISGASLHPLNRGHTMRRLMARTTLFILAAGVSISFCRAQEITPAHHLFHRKDDSAPTKVIVEMSPPEVEVRNACGDKTGPCVKRPSIFHRHFGLKHHEPEGHGGAAASFVYVPSSMPMFFSSPAPSAPAAPPAHDYLAGMRYAQDLEARMAALKAHKAAQDEADRHVQDILGRAAGHMAGLGAGYGACKAPDGAGKGFGTPPATDPSIEAKLKNIDTRLERLEQLILKHTTAIDDLNKRVPPKQ